MTSTAQAIRSRFDEICQSELLRLRRKMAALPASAQADIAAISFAIAEAISSAIEAGLDREQSDEGLAEIVGRLFAVPAGMEAVSSCGRSSHERDADRAAGRSRIATAG
jgi:glutamyl-tRNAGlu reductase-like protein